MPTDRDWELFSQAGPYYAVLSAEKFRHGAREEFFESGETFIQNLDEKLTKLFGSFSPRRTLDFGCGVGRLAIPLARRSQRVLGVDVSVSMVREAESNCRRFGITNAGFLKCDDSMSFEGEFDFVNSFIVFQHIPLKRGYAIFERMLALLSTNGIGAVHFTLKDERSWYRRVLSFLRKCVPPAAYLANALRGRPLTEAVIQMNAYSAGKILAMLEQHNCREIPLEPTNHSGHFGAIFLFR